MTASGLAWGVAAAAAILAGGWGLGMIANHYLSKR